LIFFQVLYSNFSGKDILTEIFSVFAQMACNSFTFAARYEW